MSEKLGDLIRPLPSHAKLGDNGPCKSCGGKGLSLRIIEKGDGTVTLVQFECDCQGGEG